eukprot:CAMPEP_0204171748 /NCGR_PEP_ID=MMETSP0361-20130328/43523_1 /ASSEMBLY_ACC=CAM_ASM_000343 /TAXON_ID=268821 /ORGANISM="Scrippsiella Hangoei, Strain SHTV-5" /LENGTH=35 /DNA_ID= /DNA_START= /DNA_END= /DNA_ORIENTATION=
MLRDLCLRACVRAFFNVAARGAMATWQMPPPHALA